MPTPRKHQVDLAVTHYYHCVSRCVRRAFLCGKDQETGKTFDHRKAWLVEKMKELTAFFAIDICAYAVMSNHYHLVLRVDPERASAWSDWEVVQRWSELFPMSKIAMLKKNSTPELILTNHLELIQTLRTQLYDMGWFMLVLNEGIARRANQEDECTGRFWEGRFRSQALLDDAALLTCMAYVDLNPVRGGLANTPEESDFTAIQERIIAHKTENQPNTLAPLQCEDTENALPIALETYLDLVDTSGRLLKAGKGQIPEHLQPILQRIGVDEGQWIQTLRTFAKEFAGFIGQTASLESLKIRKNRQRMRGLGGANRIFNLVA